MILNHLGKLLVLLHFAVSIVLLCWAVMLFLQPVDWGWKEPRKAWSDPPEGKKEPTNERIAAKIDERVAAWNKLTEYRTRALAAVKKAQKRLRDMEMAFAENHLYYKKELERLEKAEKIEEKDGVAEVAFLPKEGRPQLKPPVPWGLPTFGPPLGRKVGDEDKPYNKSYAGYLADLESNVLAMKDLAGKIQKAIADKEKLTIRLNGERDDEGKVKRPGEYDLVEAESEAQKRVKEELDYLRPIWVTALSNAQLFRARRLSLENRLIELGVSPSAIEPR